MKNFIISNKKNIFISLLCALLLTAFAIIVFDAPLKNEVCKYGIVSFELAKNIDTSTNIINSWDNTAKINAALSLGFDFLFLLVYSSFIALLIFNISNRLWEGKPFYKFGKLLIILIFVAALFDIIENIALIKLLLGDLRQVWSSLAFYFATLKFLIILSTFIYLIFAWLTLFFRKT